jgi:predicted GNAT family acetyltransferase
MFEVKKVDETNKQHIIDMLKQDVIRHVFAFFDIQHEPEHTTMHVALENGKLEGYILVYTAMDFPSVIIESSEEAARKLIEHAPEDKFIIHMPPELLSIARSRFPKAKSYIENWMLIKRREARFLKSKQARRLVSEDDASELVKLLSSQENRPRRNPQRIFKWVSTTPTYGIFVNNELVAYAGSFLQLPQIWMIGGVYTHPDHRNKGYSTLATSAVTEEALKNAEMAALFVRSDNYAAIRVYEKIGYRKIGEKLWVDVGTGLKP